MERRRTAAKNNKNARLNISPIGHKALYLTVKDDGRGFQKEELEHATKPFYKGMAEMGPGHFGMGLGICKIFCEKHGGCVELWNDGGAVVMAVFKM